MASSISLIFLFLSTQLLGLSLSETSNASTTVSLLMAIKASLDPGNLVLSSWSPNVTDPCSFSSFEGIACNELGQVVNISLQGKGLYGKIPPEIGQLSALSGLYLHFNNLHGVIPKEIALLTQLSDLYLNMNDLSGFIPSEIGNMPNLQVLQLCYNRLDGNIPNKLGSLKNLTVLALQSNQLRGAIPASLGGLTLLTRLDLSFNHLFGSIPVKLSEAPKLEILDLRNNTLSGNVPLGLKRLNEGFRYENNPGLCGTGFPSLALCSDSSLNPTKPEPFGQGSNHLPTKDIPESANIPHQLNQNRKPQAAAVVGIIGLFVILAVAGLFSFSWYRRRKQQIGNTIDISESRVSTDQPKVLCRRSTSPLISLEYSNGWDPLAKDQSGSALSQEVLESFMFNLDEVESATQYFSEMNLLGKSSFSAVYKGTLRDGSAVAVKCISKTSCKSDEAEFRKGLKLLTSLKHENLLRLRGFCCSKGRGECFLIYDFVSNGNLLRYLDVKDDKGKVLDWSTRTAIIKGIARGIEYLHGNKRNKPALVHRNISADKVLIDHVYKPLLSDSGLHKLLADDIVFSTLKGSAANGYLAPEYAITGRFTEKSDMYAFGVIILQILSGSCVVTQSNHQGAELCRFEDFIDAKLGKNFVESEAAKLGKIALLCTHDSPARRPTIDVVIQELNDLTCSS
nr:LRR receptor-like serine/threonine-protein kinase GSO1 [Ipomoea batatas]